MIFPKLRVLLSLVGFACAFAKAEAAITVTFSYDGTNTIGVVSGSITLPQMITNNDDSNAGPTFIGGYGALYVHVTGVPSYDIYFGGTRGASFMIAAADQWSGTGSFGFSHDALYTAFNATPGGTYSPSGTFTWNNKTLAQAGVGGFTTPVVVYTSSNGEEIRFLTNVPEPAVSGLLAGGATLAALGIRRRAR